MKKLLLAVAIVGIISDRASAVLIVNDNFEGYTSQANFQATWTPIGTTAPTSAEWSTTQSSSPTHSVRAPGTATSNQSRNQLTFAETELNSSNASFNIAPGDQLIWSFDFYDVAPTGNPQRNYANLQDGAAPGASPPGQLISIGLNNNLLATAQGGNYYMARILGAASNGGTEGAYFKLNDAGAPLRSLGWHNLKVILTSDNGSNTNYSFYVDNILSETVLNVLGNRSYDLIRIGSGLSNGSTEAFFDNMRLEFIPVAVPEPGALLAMSLVGFISAGAVWIKKRRAERAAA